MKKILIAIMILLSVLSSDAQPIPSGAYVAQPMVDHLGTVHVYWVGNMEWPNTCCFEAKTGEIGQVLEMSFSGGSADMGTEFCFEFPATSTNRAFKDIESWKKFASAVTKEFAFIVNTEDAYVEKTPFSFIGRSVVIDHWETPNDLQSLIFKKGDRLLSVQLSKWVGKTPAKVGEQILIGQDGRGDVFFPVKESDGYYTVTQEVTDRLKDRFVIDVSANKQ